MATRPTRVPEDVHQELQAAARILGRSPGELLERAWHAYRQSHEFRDDFTLAQKAFASGDLDRVSGFLAERGRDRARSRAEGVQALRSS